MSLRVVQSGLCTLVVDLGRPRSRSLGVPIGGAADRTSLILGNALVGNQPDAAALEINLAGPILRAECDVACVVFGAPFSLHSERQHLETGTTFTLESGEELHVGGTGVGVRAYLCVHGGFDAPLILGSRSAFDPVQAEMELRCASSRARSRFIRFTPAWSQSPAVLHALPGPQSDWFPARDVWSQEFTVAPASNRMGLRLQGTPLVVPPRELVSEPVCPGAVQVTRDGQCIILGMEGQTIGGYPKIAQVISADLDIVGQLRPNDPVRFERVTIEEAEGRYREQQAELSEWVMRLRTSYRAAP